MEKVSNSDNDYDESFELETPSLERLERDECLREQK